MSFGPPVARPGTVIPAEVEESLTLGFRVPRPLNDKRCLDLFDLA
jgi:hypothetical protein